MNQQKYLQHIKNIKKMESSLRLHSKRIYELESKLKNEKIRKYTLMYNNKGFSDDFLRMTVGNLTAVTDGFETVDRYLVIDTNEKIIAVTKILQKREPKGITVLT